MSQSSFLERRFNFTKKDISKLNPPQDGRKQMYYTDEKTRGLEVSVSKNGVKSFFFRRKVGGTTKRKWLGYFPDMTVEQARGRAGDLNGDISRGVDVFATSNLCLNSLTLEQLFSEYLERHARKTRKTWRELEGIFRRSCSSLHKKKVSDISHSMAEKLHETINLERGPYAANRAVQLLRAVFNKGKRWKLVEGENPFEGITLYKETPRERFLSKEEAAKVLQGLESHWNDTLRDFIKMSLFTGIRKANLMSLRWSSIDLEAGILTLDDTKNGRRQVIALGSHEQELLRKRLIRQEQGGEGTEFVFPGSGASGHVTDIKKAWYSFRREVGLEDVTIHDLRRSLGASMANANINIALVKAALHHQDMKTTLQVYARTQQDAVRDAREKVQNDWLRGISEKD